MIFSSKIRKYPSLLTVFVEYEILFQAELAAQAVSINVDTADNLSLLIVTKTQIRKKGFVQETPGHTRRGATVIIVSAAAAAESPAAARAASLLQPPSSSVPASRQRQWGNDLSFLSVSCDSHIVSHLYSTAIGEVARETEPYSETTLLAFCHQ